MYPPFWMITFSILSIPDWSRVSKDSALIAKVPPRKMFLMTLCDLFLFRYPWTDPLSLASSGMYLVSGIFFSWRNESLSQSNVTTWMFMKVPKSLLLSWFDLAPSIALEWSRFKVYFKTGVNFWTTMWVVRKGMIESVIIDPVALIRSMAIGFNSGSYTWMKQSERIISSQTCIS